MDKNKRTLVEKGSKAKTIVRVGNTEIGGEKIIIMAGPCAVESKEQVHEIAKAVKEAGAAILRGGAYKLRTYPYSFCGLEEEGLKLLKDAGEKNNLATISEIIDNTHIPLFLEYVDVFQVGARNMQNFSLLKELGKIKKPVLLKRGLGSTIDELLGAAEYILYGGNPNVILCERGIRTFEPKTRFTLDIAAVPLLNELTHLPVVVDPSHPAGRRDIVPSLAKAGVAAGADGLIIEIHNKSDEALCDADQALTFEQFNILMDELPAMAKASGRDM